MAKTKPETWEARYNAASGDQTKMFKRFSDWYDSLYAVVGTTASPWRSKMYVPILARQTWALISKFLSIKPSFVVRVNDLEQDDNDIDERAEKAQRKLEYDFENPYMDETMRDKLFSALLDTVVTGTGLVKVPWCVEQKVTYKRKPKSDGTWDLTQEEKTTKTISYNDIEPVNIFNVFVSPGATNLYDAPWIIIKEYKTLDELNKINKANGGKLYTNLDKLSGSTSYDQEMSTYNYSRNRLLNSEDRKDSSVKMVKIFECYEGNMIYTYAESTDDDVEEGWIKLREQKNPYWHGKYPLVKFHVKNRPYQFWGEGIFETTYRLQAGYNDVFNHIMDQWNLSENSMLMAPERANVNDYVIEPGGTITYRGDIAPTQFKHATPDFQGTQVLLQLMDSAVEGVTISNYASGIPNSASDKTKGTATGILHLQEAAGDLVSFMRANFQQSVTQIGRMWLSNNQQFMSEPLKLTVTTKGQKIPMTINPEDMQGDMELIIDDASMDPTSQDQKAAQYQLYTQQLMAMQQASIQQAQASRWATSPLWIDFNSVVEDMSLSMNHANYDKFLLSGKVVEEAIQNAQTPMVQPNERVNLQANDLLPDEMAQLLQRNGIQPSPARMRGAQSANQVIAQGDAAASMAKAQQAAQPTGGDTKGPKSLGESVSWKPADLTDYERAQALQQVGIEADPSGMAATPAAQQQATQETLDIHNAAHSQAQAQAQQDAMNQQTPPTDNPQGLLARYEASQNVGAPQ